ncbi:hypothetical protein DEU56DRAFT_808280 [Suillus clintonianus]|uniref:uncharacterized protein n=1 Tax=Suillus clintonianus TaxID=1904413 RepID=UPI001B85EB6F|nr:uncharacterized protein DEU56DRAFT_808280 [Suillus clintonianus]KAG2135150.1 hypothetical protein DEU56DRAFT_808280 [Suillus clintonianus]
MRSRILSVTSASASPFEQIFQLGSGESSGRIAVNLLIFNHLAAVIIFEHSFYVFDQRRHLKDQQESVPSFNVALGRYMASPYAITVRDSVKTAVHAYQEPPVGTAVHTNEGNSSNWKAKLLFGRFRRKKKQSFKPSQGKVKESFECSQEMAKQPMDCSGLIERILAITLEHRLPRP